MGSPRTAAVQAGVAPKTRKELSATAAVCLLVFAAPALAELDLPGKTTGANMPGNNPSNAQVWQTVNISGNANRIWHSAPSPTRGSGTMSPNDRSSGGGENKGPGTQTPAKEPKQKEKPESDKNTDETAECPTENPVVIASGEKLKFEQDFKSFGAYGISLTRTYRSSSPNIGPFGPHWRSSLEYSALVFSGCVRTADSACEPASITFTDPSGARFTYNRKSPLSTLYTVKDNAAAGGITGTTGFKWTVTKNNTRYIYGGDGRIQKIQDITGVDHLLFTLNSIKQLTRVTNTVGQFVELTYANGRAITVKDPAGQVWSYGYDANGMLKTVTSPGALSDVRTYHYESPVDNKLLTGISVNGVRYSTYSYFPDKKVKESGLTGGEERDTFSYSTNQTVVTSANGHVTTYNYAPIGASFRNTSISRAAGQNCAAASAQTIYDAAGYIDYTLDWNGHKTDYSYDATGKLLSVTSAFGTPSALTKTNTWQGDEIVEETFQNANGIAYARVNYTYFPSSAGYAYGRVASVTQTDVATGAQRSVSFGYTFHANKAVAMQTLTRAIPGGSAVTTHSFDTLGNLVSTTNPVGHTVSYSNYNGLGQPGRMVDINGVATDYVYAPNGPLRSTTQYLSNGNRVTTFAYNNDRQLTDVSYASGRVDRLRYNAAGRLEYVGNALNQFVRTAFDVAGNSLTESAERHTPSSSPPVATSSGSFSATTRLDALRRPWQSLGNSGQQVTYTYDNNGNVKTRTDAAGHQTLWDYDPQNRVERSTAPDGVVTLFRYNAEGRLDYVQDHRGLRTSYVYNGLGQKLTQSSPDSGTTTYTYDSAGRLATESLANGIVITYGWDALDRLRTRTSAGVTETYTYDEGTYGKGRLTRINDATGQTTYGYTAAGELASQVNTIFGNTYTTSWTYDSAGRLQSLAYATGLTLTYGYDSVGRLALVSSNVSGWTTLADSFLYQPATDKRYAWRFGNGLPRLVNLDTDGRIAQVASPGVHNLTFGYHNVNTIRTLTDHVYPSTSATFGYNSADRLTSVSSSADNQVFGIDGVGNRTSHTRNGYAYSYTLDNASNRLLSWSGGPHWRNMGYDAAGNLRSETRSDGARTYDYDAFNRLTAVSISGGPVGDYRNNALNQRAYRGAAGTGTGYVYGPAGELLYEVGPQTTGYVWLGGELLGIARGGQFFASHNDHLGRPEVMTNIGQSVVWRAQNAAFDRSVVYDTIGGMNVGFPGQYYDAETRLWQNWHRYYDASLGRYTQSDPIGLVGGLNTYAYVAGNPLSLTDANGLQWQRALDALRYPDYGTFTVPILPTIGITFTLDRAGTFYAGLSLGVNLPGSSGRAAGVGWTGDLCTPTADQQSSFLSGWALNAGVGPIAATWSSPWSDTASDPASLGLNVQVPGASIGYNWRVGNFGFGW